MDASSPTREPGHETRVLPLDSLSPSRSVRTLLPRPFATAVSLLTATSSLSLRMGSAIGIGLVGMGRVTTLSAFELTRAALEGILMRAGQDLVQSSHGDMSKARAEGILQTAIVALHQVITTSSFLVSASFQMSSTGITSSLAFAETLLSGLNSLFGDTDTSKAVATIIALVQREMSNPTSDHIEESVGLANLLTSTVAFVLLQRWSKRRTRMENSKTGTTEVIWDIVVLADAMDQPMRAPAASPQLPFRRNKIDPRQRPLSSASFMSALGDSPDVEATSPKTTRLFLPDMSDKHYEYAAGGRSRLSSSGDQIMSQLTPGTNVRITAESTTLDSITIEVESDDATLLKAPLGYHLIQTEDIELGRRRLVFARKIQKRKTGECEVPMRSSTILQELDRDAPIARLASTSPCRAVTEDRPQANQKRLRTSNAPNSDVHDHMVPSLNKLENSSSSEVPSPVQNSSQRQISSPRKAYKNLVDLWNGTQLRNKSSDRQQEAVTRRIVPLSSTNLYSPSAAALSRSESSTSMHASQLSLESSSSLTADRLAAWNDRVKPATKAGRHHRRTASVYSVVSAASETSLVVHARPEESGRDAVKVALTRSDRMPGQYPDAPFAENILRFLRFSIASYGESFLRILGTVSNDLNTGGNLSLDELKEHFVFSTYTGLPPSTVLLSSYVDPHGVPLAKDRPDSGTVLVHYVSLDHDSKAVVLTCRGTLGVEDILTDMAADYEGFYWEGELHQVHQGILAAAYKLLRSRDGRVLATLAAALEEFPEYGLILCGHSLGGSVVSVLAMLLSQPTGRGDGNGAFVTRSYDHRCINSSAQIDAAEPPRHLSALPLPSGRPIQVYAYGPAASVSPSLQKATRGLVTTILHGQDSVSFLSLGTLRDFQSVARAFKADSAVKQEIKRRLWDKLSKAFTDRNGSTDQWLPPDALSEDPWPWFALQGLRSNLNAVKLLPPGDVFHIETQPVLQRHAFVSGSTDDPDRARTFKPATHVTMTYIKDVEAKFREIEFGASMWLDHMPTRYEAALQCLESGVRG